MQTTDNYPTGKILTCYALFGGLMGGALFCIGTGLFLGIEQLTNHTFRTDLTAFKDVGIGFTVIMLASWLLGLIPAFFTGFILAKTFTKQQIIKPFFIGAILSFLFFFLIFGLLASDVLRGLTSGLIFALIGGLSSVIVGKFVLPKS